MKNSRVADWMFKLLEVNGCAIINGNVSLFGTVRLTLPHLSAPLKTIFAHPPWPPVGNSCTADKDFHFCLENLFFNCLLDIQMILFQILHYGLSIIT